jgi:hypothetical protein
MAREGPAVDTRIDCWGLFAPIQGAAFVVTQSLVT